MGKHAAPPRWRRNARPATGGAFGKRRSSAPGIRLGAFIAAAANADSNLGVVLVGLTATRLAVDVNASVGVVQAAVTVAACVSIALTLAELITRRGLLPKRLIAAGYALAAVTALWMSATRHPLPLFACLCATACAGRMGAPLRSVIARAQRATRGARGSRDGEFNALAVAWTTGVQVAGGVVFALLPLSALPIRQTGGIALAAWLASVALMLMWFPAPPATTAVDRAREPRKRVQLQSSDFVLGVLALTLSTAVFNLVYLDLNPRLSELGLGGWIVGFMALLSLGRLATLRRVVRYGRRSNDAAKHAAMLSTAWVLGSGVVALAAAFTDVVWLALPGIVLGFLGLEVGVSSLNAVARTFADRLAVLAASFTTLGKAVGIAAGSLFAAHADWQEVAVAWVAAGFVALVCAWKPSLRKQGPTTSGTTRSLIVLDHRAPAPERERGAGRAGMMLELALMLDESRGYEPARYRIGREDRITIRMLKDPADPESGEATVTRLIYRDRSRPRTPRRTSGRLRLLTCFPLVHEGLRCGTGVWLGPPGEWWLDADGRQSLRSGELAGRKLWVRRLQHRS